MNNSGSKKANIILQPSVLTISPPKEGPTAGAIAAISEAIPIIKPILSKGACSNTILNISGRAMPAPMPCRILPNSKNMKPGAIMHIMVAIIKMLTAKINNCFMRNRLFRKDDSGMIIESTRRYPVVIHCTVAVFTPNCCISVGNVTFIEVATTTPVKDRRPVAMTDRINFKSSFLSNLFSICL